MTNMPTDKQHYVWIDYAKCFSIILVIAFHCPGWNKGYMGDLLQLLRMPAFFLIAGYLFRTEKFNSLWAFIRHRSIQLLIPFTSFFIIFYILWVSFGRRLTGGEELDIPIYMPIIEFIKGTPVTVVATYWFIACLLSMQIIYYLSSKFLPRSLSFIFILAGPFVYDLPIVNSLPWNIPLALQYLPYYAFANIYKDYITNLGKSSLPKVVIPLIVTLFGLTIVHQVPTPLQAPLRILLGLCILPTYILIIKGLSKVVNYRKSISGVSSAINATAAYIGRNTIVILAVQNYIIGFIKILFASSIIQIESAEDYTMVKFALNIAITLTTIITSIPIIYLINKYTPWFIGRGAFWKRKLQQYS